MADGGGRGAVRLGAVAHVGGVRAAAVGVAAGEWDAAVTAPVAGVAMGEEVMENGVEVEKELGFNSKRSPASVKSLEAVNGPMTSVVPSIFTSCLTSIL